MGKDSPHPPAHWPTLKHFYRFLHAVSFLMKQGSVYKRRWLLLSGCLAREADGGCVCVCVCVWGVGVCVCVCVCGWWVCVCVGGRGGGREVLGSHKTEKERGGRERSFLWKSVSKIATRCQGCRRVSWRGACWWWKGRRGANLLLVFSTINIWQWIQACEGL